MAALPSIDLDQASELAVANRILVARGVLDAFGHVSVRSHDREHFLLSRNLAPALVTAADIQYLDLEGVAGDDRPSYLERYIHAAIYRARPDVGAVVHSHAPAVLPFTVVSAPLRAIVHTAGFLARPIPRFDTREHRGDGTHLLVDDIQLGHALAARLGDSPVGLMRGHGFVSVAPTLVGAVMQSVYTEVNARVQREAAVLGEPTFLTEAEGDATAVAMAGQAGRAWEVWSRDADLRGLARQHGDG